MLKWLYSLILPVKSVYGDFVNNRSANIYRLTHNSQVCYLRKVLNDAFDMSQRRIYIADGNRFPRLYIYTSGEQQKKYLGKMYLRQFNDFADSGVDFRVIVPEGFDISGNSAQLNALINMYKLASKRYKINIENE